MPQTQIKLPVISNSVCSQNILVAAIILLHTVCSDPKGLFRPDAPTSYRRRLYCINFLMRRGRSECSDWQTCSDSSALCFTPSFWADACGLNRPLGSVQTGRSAPIRRRKTGRAGFGTHVDGHQGKYKRRRLLCLRLPSFKMTKAKTPEWQVGAFWWKNCLA